jgi:hypothetical protein
MSGYHKLNSNYYKPDVNLELYSCSDYCHCGETAEGHGMIGGIEHSFTPYREEFSPYPDEPQVIPGIGRFLHAQGIVQSQRESLSARRVKAFGAIAKQLAPKKPMTATEVRQQHELSEWQTYDGWKKLGRHVCRGEKSTRLSPDGPVFHKRQTAATVNVHVLRSGQVSVSSAGCATPYFGPDDENGHVWNDYEIYGDDDP